MTWEKDAEFLAYMSGGMAAVQALCIIYLALEFIMTFPVAEQAITVAILAHIASI